MIIKKVTVKYIVQAARNAAVNTDVYDCLAKTVTHLDPNNDQPINTQETELDELGWMAERKAALGGKPNAYLILGFWCEDTAGNVYSLPL